jgi:hypothetical protein
VDFGAAVEPDEGGFLQKHMAVRRSDIDPPGVEHLAVPANIGGHLAVPVQNIWNKTGIPSDVNRDGDCGFTTGGEGFRYRANGRETTRCGADNDDGEVSIMTERACPCSQPICNGRP